MYKRKARILFIDESRPALARLAQRYAKQLGAEHLSARRLDNPQAPVQTLQWADLIVSFSQSTLDHLPPLAQTTRTKLWPLRVDEDLPQQLHERVSAMIGGMRMLARLDSRP